MQTARPLKEEDPRQMPTLSTLNGGLVYRCTIEIKIRTSLNKQAFVEEQHVYQQTGVYRLDYYYIICKENAMEMWTWRKTMKVISGMKKM